MNEVILERDGIFSAEVMAGEDLKLHFTPVGQSFNAVTCNGETIPFEADGFTYSVTMQNQDTKLYFHFVVVNKAILEAALDVANTVTEEELEDLADTVKPVSYTHLDVILFRRYAGGSTPQDLAFSGLCSPNPSCRGGCRRVYDFIHGRGRGSRSSPWETKCCGYGWQRNSRGRVNG